MTIDVQGSDDLLGFPVSPGQSMKRKELHVLVNWKPADWNDNLSKWNCIHAFP